MAREKWAGRARPPDRQRFDRSRALLPAYPATPDLVEPRCFEGAGVGLRFLQAMRRRDPDDAKSRRETQHQALAPRLLGDGAMAMARERISPNEPQPVIVRAGNARLPGMLLFSSRPLGLVLFAEVSGSSFASPSNLFLARRLEGAGFASAIVNLLTWNEAAADARTGWLRNDTTLLASRVNAAQRWLAARPDTASLPLGLFVTGDAAAAGLVAAAETPGISAIVCCPNQRALPESGAEHLSVPTLLIVGEDPAEMQAANHFFESLSCENDRAVVAGAGRRFERTGALESAAALASLWFSRHLVTQWQDVEAAASERDASVNE